MIDHGPGLVLRLAREGLWPSAPGIETLRIHDDGTRDVRVLGYLNAYVDEPEVRISLASDDYTGVALGTPDALVAPLRSFARSGRGRMTGPGGSFNEVHRAQTMWAAVGTCGYRTWVSGVAARSRPGTGLP